jgi:cytochrome c peroxidase
MHAGQVASLTDVVRHYSKAPQAATGQSELKPLHLSESEVRDLVAFLGALN